MHKYVQEMTPRPPLPALESIARCILSGTALTATQPWNMIAGISSVTVTGLNFGEDDKSPERVFTTFGQRRVQ